jgi:hypothetical protein
LQLLLLEFIDGTSIFVDNLVNGDNLEPRVGGVAGVWCRPGDPRPVFTARHGALYPSER